MTDKITALDKTTVALVQRRINDALAPLADELGLRIMFRGGSYSGGEANLKLNVQVKPTDGGVVATAEAQIFRMSASIFGLKPEDLGRTFKDGDHTYQIIGCTPRGHKRPIVVRREDGKEYKMAADGVVRALAREAAGGGK